MKHEKIVEVLRDCIRQIGDSNRNQRLSLTRQKLREAVYWLEDAIETDYNTSMTSRPSDI